MASIINTNIQSLTAQRNLSTTQSSLSTSMQRLSSGLRINSAKDDAAGLAIAERFTTQIRGLNQAARNANDGISLSQTSEGALGEISNNLQRIRELAVQSTNATNSTSDRAALDLEVQQRLSEIDRVSAQTSFNGRKVLDGSFGSASFQVGANVGDTIGINLNTSMRYSSLGKIADYVAAGTAYSGALDVGRQGSGVTTGALAGNLTIAVGTGTAVTVGASVAGTGAGQSAGSAYAKALAINGAAVSGLNVAADTTVEFAFVTTASTAAFSLAINGVSVQGTTAVPGVTAAQTVSNINANAASTGVTAALNGANIILNAADGRDITITQVGAAANGFGAMGGTNNSTNTTLTMAAGTATKTAVGTLHLFATDTITLGAGTDALALGYTASTSLSVGATALNAASVTTVNNANTMITRIDAALTAVSSLRSTFGAIQNRFDSVIANLSSTSENLTSSRSRVQDADFAAETASLSRAQILQQAGTAMVAQANQLPQGVLALLR